MPRELRPCGTQSAYRRHLNRGEDPCAPCRAANAKRTQVGTVYSREVDAALAANPPEIKWRRKSNGVYVAVEVNDPHTEGHTRRQPEPEIEVTYPLVDPSLLKAVRSL